MKTSLIIPLIVAAPFCHAQTRLTATDALKLAAQNRPALQAARLNIQQAKDASRALGAYAPTTFLLGASSRSELGSDEDLQLSQPLDLFGRSKAGQAVGEAGVQLSMAEYITLATELQTEVLTAYAEAAANQQQQEVAAQLLKITEGLLTATKRRFDEGKVAETQVTRANIEFERSKQSAELSRAALGASLERLSGLIGTAASSIAVQPEAVLEPILDAPLERRPELLVLKSQVRMAEAEAEVAGASNRPELTAQILRSPWSDEPGYFAGRLQLSWALYDHGRARLETSAATKRAEAARRLLEDATMRAKAEVRAAQITLEARQRHIERYELILTSARDLVDKAQRGYSEGFGTQMDVLEATRALREVEQELVDARQQLALAVIEQYRASGFLAEVLK